MSGQPLPEYLHDKGEIEAFLRQDVYLHLYALGDLDDFFWPYTSWLARRVEGQVVALVLTYAGAGLPAVLALANHGQEHLRELFPAALRLLPAHFYSQISPGIASATVGSGYRLDSRGSFLKMRLDCPEKLGQVDTAGVEQLTPADEPALRALYAAAYPGNWFDPRMLQTGCYYGVRRDGAILSAAGIHVYSPEYRAAALGNITTHPAYRGQGLGKAVTARLCQALLQTVDQIGLNVRAENAPAVAAYTRLGFTPHAEYEEVLFERGCGQVMSGSST